MLHAGCAMPRDLYTPRAAMEIDGMVQERGLAGSVLMERAGQGAWRLALALWPRTRRVVVCCGHGNNGGDGAVFARCALEHGCKVQALVPNGTDLCGPGSRQAWQKYAAAGGSVVSKDIAIDEDADLVVDAMFGTGFSRAPEGIWAELITAVNASGAKVLALDVPSGLNAANGACPGVAVRADATISFIVPKQGLFTASGPDRCGATFCDDLAVPPEYLPPGMAASSLIVAGDHDELLRPRAKDSHKGSYGHVLVVGGNRGTPGAVWLAAAAAARAGAGLVSVATRDGNCQALSSHPEIMVHAVEQAGQLEPLLRAAGVCVIGPGLGKDEWARELLARVLEHDCKLLLDADALNLLAKEPPAGGDDRNWTLTPHPKEAARLLACGSGEVQADRFAAAAALQRRYGGVALLKGSGSIVADSDGVAVVHGGNPGMASGGMGDALSGVIASLAAQGVAPAAAAKLGACVHAAAGDAAAASGGERGMQASDLLPWIRHACNPYQTSLGQHEAV